MLFYYNIWPMHIVHCTILNRIVLGLFTCSYISLHITRETVPQMHGIFLPLFWYLFKLIYLLEQCFSKQTVHNNHSMWGTPIQMIDWGTERPKLYNLPKLYSWEKSQWDLAQRPSILPLYWTASTKKLLGNRLLSSTWYLLNQNPRNVYVSMCVCSTFPSWF